jgi:thiol-disulfide isomerase/thioredoxin
VLVHKGWALIGPSVINENKRELVVYDSWQLRDIYGNEINFEDLHGSVVFLNFWATWCPPCIAEMPSLNELYTDYNNKVRFVLVSNEKVSTVRKFMEKNNYDLNSYVPLSYYPENFKVRSIPRTFLIDKDGRIVIDKNGAANWNSQKVRMQLEELIK